MTFRQRLALSAATLLVASCAHEIITPAGPAPANADAERLVRAYLSRSLRDPESMKSFAMTSGPHRVQWQRGKAFRNRMDQGWAYCFEYNAKNAYGAYAGITKDILVMRQQAFGPDIVTDVEWGRVKRPC